MFKPNWLRGFAGVVVIPSSVKGKIVIALGKGLFANCIKVVEYKLPETIETIESQCFASNAMLEKINIPESCKKIDDYAFSLCKKLCEVEMGGNQKLENLLLPDVIGKWHKRFESEKSFTY